MKPYYDQDGITIYHADCADVLPYIAPSEVSLLLTDPPYGTKQRLNISGQAGTIRGGTEIRPWKANQYPPLHGDDKSFDPSPILRQAERVVLWGANHFAHHLPPSPTWLVWNRCSGNSSTADAELAWTNLGGTVRIFTHLWNGYGRASEIGFHVHPTQKPVALMRWVLQKWSAPGDLILDPYMGSGPVAQACHEMDRRYIGIEIEERYCEIAVQRLAQGVLAFDS